jgi:hypothetical protein
MRRFWGKAVAAAVLAIILTLACCGCTMSVSKPLTAYYGEGTVVAARYYSGGMDGYLTEELPAEQLAALTETLDAMELRYHFFHTDYYWGDRFGIELERADGTFLTYDGTELGLRDASMANGGAASEHELKGEFVEVTNGSFWEAMAPFFPSTAGLGLPEW